MLYKKLVAYSILIGFIPVMIAMAQPGYDDLSLKARVLNLVFPSDPSFGPYYVKMILRFGDSDSQIAIIVHPGGNSEVIQYRLAGMRKGDLDQLIGKMQEKNPNVREQEIAAKLKVDVGHSAMESRTLADSLDSLKAIQISPFFTTRVAMDNYSEFEFWFYSGQESVHYIVTGSFNDAPQDKLVEWMTKFRASLPDLIKANSAPGSDRNKPRAGVGQKRKSAEKNADTHEEVWTPIAYLRMPCQSIYAWHRHRHLRPLGIDNSQWERKNA
jgi:hypothetical protein